MTLEEREDVAGRCVAALELTIPPLVDDMSDSVNRAYEAWPDRLYVLKADGTIGYASARGPRGFDVAAMTRMLEEIMKSERGPK